jgi:hypothetical protein
MQDFACKISKNFWGSYPDLIAGESDPYTSTHLSTAFDRARGRFALPALQSQTPDLHPPSYSCYPPVPKSRASGAALSAVLRTTTLSYGNMRFSGTCPADTPQPIKMKYCTIGYVGKTTRCVKNGCNRLAGGGPTDR